MVRETIRTLRSPPDSDPSLPIGQSDQATEIRVLGRGSGGGHLGARGDVKVSSDLMTSFVWRVGTELAMSMRPIEVVESTRCMQTWLCVLPPVQTQCSVLKKDPGPEGSALQGAVPPRLLGSRGHPQSACPSRSSAKKCMRRTPNSQPTSQYLCHITEERTMLIYRKSTIILVLCGKTRLSFLSIASMTRQLL
ncbi:hypothetical protein BO99DRAFT_73530 [Aspergillus violaceofuscus CBS 115571]|uniref:Uncharacterized protein n=1 Tax=Aspergillus violaceofuscus (strain CBS 115571) TaxID=1450538 RepID=A0A2V5GPT1_ASPV1|nr:hypothetical protein BO99DRAFT_73530 [Aspergillus violaceofuscus CBS 115571]